MDFILYSFIALIVFGILDFIWLGLIAKQFYRDQLGSLFAKKVKVAPAVVFYLLFILGLVYFVIEPAVDEASLSYAAFGGAFLGLLCYATYGLTNWATIEKWPSKMAVVDIVWGTIVTMATAVISYAIIAAL